MHVDKMFPVNTVLCDWHFLVDFKRQTVTGHLCTSDNHKSSSIIIIKLHCDTLSLFLKFNMKKYKGEDKW